MAEGASPSPDGGLKVSSSSSQDAVFGPFRFDRANGFLYRNGVRLALPPRATGVLAVLVARPGQVVSKQALLDEVWKDTHVTDTSLAEAVSLLRQALGDDPQRGDYIQTIPRRGYRFAASIEGPEALAVPATQGPPVEDDRPLWTPWLPWVLAVVGGILGTSILWSLRQQPAAPRETVARFTLALPDGYQVADRAPALAFAPDSSAVAFVAARPGESPKLFVRSLADAASRELSGTDGAEAPFFSPDARTLGYFAGGRLLRIAVAGGEPVPLADAPAPGGGVWADDGIVFAARWGEGLSRVPEAGGPVRAVTTLDSASGDARHAWPRVDATGLVLYASDRADGDRGVRVQARSQSTLRTSTVAEHATFPWLLPTGELIVWRGDRPLALPFDPRTLIHERDVPLPLTVRRSRDGAPLFALSSRGAAVSVPAPSDGISLSWITLDGRRADGPAPHSRTPVALEADGENLFASTSAAGAIEYWRINLARGTQMKLQAPPPRVTAGLASRLVVHQPALGLDIVVARPGTAEPVARVSTAADETDPAISPDGALLAWTSTSAAVSQIALAPVRRLSDPNAVQIVAAGSTPTWSRDGATLWFLKDDTLMASAVDRMSGVAAPARLVADGVARILGTAPDGRVLVVGRDRPATALDVVLGWSEEVRARLAQEPLLPRSFR